MSTRYAGDTTKSPAVTYTIDDGSVTASATVTSLVTDGFEKLYVHNYGPSSVYILTSLNGTTYQKGDHPGQAVNLEAASANQFASAIPASTMGYFPVEGFAAVKLFQLTAGSCKMALKLA